MSARASASSAGHRATAWLSSLRERSDPWTDLGLTLPIFLGYHAGVAFLPKRNAADFVSSSLVDLAGTSVIAYLALTLAIGGVLVGTLMLLGRGTRLHWRRYLRVLAEGALYALAMKLAATWIVGSMRLGAGQGMGPFAGLVMSMGAGFYEEVAFRVVLFGLGAKLILHFVKQRPVLVILGWGLLTAIVFSGWHYVGPFRDDFALGSFVFRIVCGAFLATIYRLRGFAPAVWCHTLYDAWVLVF